MLGGGHDRTSVKISFHNLNSPLGKLVLQRDAGAGFDTSSRTDIW